MLLGLSGCRESGGTGSVSATSSGGATGVIGTRLSNGSFTAAVETIEYDIEGPGGMNPGEYVYRTTVVVANPNTPVLHFDEIVVKLFGGEKLDRDHFSSFKNGNPDQVSEILLANGQGSKVTATTPEDSVDKPKVISVSLLRGGKPVEKPILFVVKDSDIKNGPLLQTALEQSGGKLVRSNAMDYAGPSVLELRPKADLLATKWNSTAKLCSIRANEHAIFGDPLTQQTTGISVSSWRFLYSAEGKAFTVTLGEEVNDGEAGDDSAIQEAGRLIPINSFKLDVAEAISIAAKNGNKVRSGPWLNVMLVKGAPTPLWVMPGTRGTLVNANTGEMVSPSDVNDK